MNDSFGRPQTALVLGAGSDLAVEILRSLAARGLERVVLAGPRPEQIRTAVASVTGVEVLELIGWDVTDRQGHGALLADAQELLGDIDVVLCAVGALVADAGIGIDDDAADRLLDVNFAAPAGVLLVAGRALSAQGHGMLVVLSSVAAVRPRRSNFVYGAAKAGLDAFARGLADAVVGDGVGCLVVRPGFVHTKMTEGMEAAPFSVTPEVVGEAVAEAIVAGRDGVLYVPRVLRLVTLAMAALPTRLWRRVSADR